MNTAFITDQQLIIAFHNYKTEQSNTFSVAYENSIKTVTAKNITEAKKLAREYGVRFLGQKLIGVTKESN